MTYEGKNKKRVTIISAYRTYITNDNQGIFTAHSQQLDILEERQQEHDNIREKRIRDLIAFINSLSACSHDITI